MCVYRENLILQDTLKSESLPDPLNGEYQPLIVEYIPSILLLLFLLLKIEEKAITPCYTSVTPPILALHPPSTKISGRISASRYD